MYCSMRVVGGVGQLHADGVGIISKPAEELAEM